MSATDVPSSTSSRPVDGSGGRPTSASAWSGVLIGIGVAAFVDEALFHLLLHWHHFYDRSTLAAGLVSDGLLHAFGWFAVVFGLVWMSDLRRRAGLVAAALAGGVMVGAGGFQLYDGTMHHKVLRLHQIRYHVDLFRYDLSWNLAGALVLVAGVVLLWRARMRAGARAGARERVRVGGGADR